MAYKNCQCPVKPLPSKASISLLLADPNGSASFVFMARLAIIIFLLAQLAGLGCRSTPEPQNLARCDFTSPHMGTLFKISLFAADNSLAKSAADAAFRRIAELDNIMSDYQADSELMILCDKPCGQPVAVSEDLFAVLRQAQKIS